MPLTHRTVHKISRETEIRLRRYEITTMSLVELPFIVTMYNMPKMQQI